MERKNSKNNEETNKALVAEENGTGMMQDPVNEDTMLKAIESMLMNDSSVVLLKGNAGKDAEAIPNTDGKMAKFSLAVNHFRYERGNGFRPMGDDGKETDWYNVEVRRELVPKALQEVKKGSKIMMIGKLRKVKYTNKAGQLVTDTKVIVSDFWALGA